MQRRQSIAEQEETKKPMNGFGAYQMQRRNSIKKPNEPVPQKSVFGMGDPTRKKGGFGTYQMHRRQSVMQQNETIEEET